MIPYFLSNISAEKCRNQIVCVKLIASRRWDVFETLRTFALQKTH